MQYHTAKLPNGDIAYVRFVSGGLGGKDYEASFRDGSLFRIRLNEDGSFKPDCSGHRYAEHGPMFVRSYEEAERAEFVEWLRSHPECVEHAPDWARTAVS
jgi:hypothetical protein